MSWGKERVMTAPIRVSERDLHTLLGIVAGVQVVRTGDVSRKAIFSSSRLRAE